MVRRRTPSVDGSIVRCATDCGKRGAEILAQESMHADEGSRSRRRHTRQRGRSPRRTEGVPVTSELVERAQRGDHEAFEALAVPAYHRLYAIARRILRDGYAAEDAVQDTLVGAWRNIRSLRDP